MKPNKYAKKMYAQRNYNPFSRKAPVIKYLHKHNLIVQVMHGNSGVEYLKHLPEDNVWFQICLIADEGKTELNVCEMKTDDDWTTEIRVTDFEGKKPIVKRFEFRDYSSGEYMAPHTIWDACFWIVKNLLPPNDN